MKFFDLSGQRFGRLLVLKRAPNKQNGRIAFLCKCDCDKETSISSHELKSGNTRSCGCLRRENFSTRFIDLSGQRFDRLLVIKRVLNKKKHTIYLCECSCGKKTDVSSAHLKSGKIRSCGCLRIEKNRRGNAPGEGGLHILYAGYREHSRKKGREFKLTMVEFNEITKQNCYYCGDKPNMLISTGKKNKIIYSTYLYNGIDRIDNTKGYFIDNVVPCCKNCNGMKSSHSQQFFIDHMTKILSNLKKGFFENKTPTSETPTELSPPENKGN